MTFMMSTNRLDKNFWEQRYRELLTGWDIGYVSNPIKEYIDQLSNKNLKILIPGAGNSYEAEYLWKQGFKNIYILDIARQPLKNLKSRVPEIPDDRLIQNDFFSFNDSFDLIIEQTFFCALNPDLRQNYAKKMSELLQPNGKLIGLLFDFELTDEGPPFGGSKNEYIDTFKNLFKIITLEKAYNSIKQRQDRELFFIFENLK